VVAAVARQRRGNRQQAQQLQALAAVLALVALGVAAGGVDERTGAAALAIPPVLVLVACRPRRLLSRQVAWRRVGGTALGLLVVAGLLLGPGGGPGHTSIALTKGHLGNAEAAIADADARFLADSLGAADRTPGARCYFVELGAAYANQVACGPLVHPDEASAQGPWDLYPARVENGELRLAKPREGQLVDTARLWRPDDLRPPQAEDVAAGATANPGFSTQLSSGELDGARTTDGFVLAGTAKVAVTGIAHPDEVTDERDVTRTAPAGYRLVAANLQLDGVEGTTLEVLSGQDRVDVTPTVAPDGNFYRSGWLVAVAHDDGVDPVLEVTYRGRAQRLSLATGERLGDDPLLYHPRSQAIDREIAGVDVPITVPIPAPHPGEVHLGSYTVARADLRSFDPNLGWAPPGRAWLVVGIDGLGTSFFDSDVDVDEVFRFDQLRSFSLRPAGGQELLVPVGVAPTEDSQLGAVFAVSDRTTEATFRAAPRWRLLLGDKALDVTAPPTDVRIVL
jgi:hypothetical protein